MRIRAAKVNSIESGTLFCATATVIEDLIMMDLFNLENLLCKLQGELMG